MKRMNFRDITTILIALFMIGVGLVSCNDKIPTPQEVAQKIDASEKLTQADYTSIFDYCGEYAKKAQQYLDMINSQPNDSTPEYTRAVSEMASLYQEYKYLDMFRDVIYQLPATELDDANQKKVEEYSKYQAFPLPEGSAQDLISPNDVGAIEDMPDSANGQVISTGAGEAVDINVK